MDNSETIVFGGQRNRQETTKDSRQGYVRTCYDIIDDSFSVICEHHHIYDLVDRNESVFYNNCMPVEKLTENIVSWERRYQELATAVNNQTELIK